MDTEGISINYLEQIAKNACALVRENGITIVYTRESCDNPDLTLVREGVYLLKE